MDVIIEDNLLYRFKKKWVNRFCKLVRTNNFSDSVKLLVFTYDESKSKRTYQMGRKSYQMISKHVVYGHLHGIHMHNEAHVMFLVCKNTVECLAFKEFNLMKVWSDHLMKHLNDISQPVTLIYADKYSQLKPKLDGRLFFNCSHISFIRDPSCSEPKLLMSWKIADILEYGCSKEIKKNSSKSKLKNGSIDLSQNIFFIKASQMCYQAPNNHIFSCHTPKQFCDRLGSNQDNFHSPNEYDPVMQRSRIDSFSSIRSNLKSNEVSNFYSELNLESPSNDSNKFFPETSQLRLPRFLRSISEVPQRRTRMDSGNSINGEHEFDLTDNNNSLMYQPFDSAGTSDAESPARSATFTWLERYPYEKEPTRLPHRRLISDTNHEYRTFSNNSWIPDYQPVIPKLNSNYCSLMNLRPKSKVYPDTSQPTTNLDNSLSIPKEIFPLHLDKNQGLISRRSAKVNDEIKPSQNADNCIPGYASLEFTQIFEQINELCSTGIDIDTTLKAKV